MNSPIARRAHWSFWVIGSIALIWNFLGIMNFIMQMNVGAVAAMPEAQRAIIESRPAWATGAFALVVFGGALGCLLLLLRKSFALYLFWLSLIGVLVQMLPYLGLSNTIVSLAPVEISLYLALPLAIAVFLIWYSQQAKRNRWLQ